MYVFSFRVETLKVEIFITQADRLFPHYYITNEFISFLLFIKHFNSTSFMAPFVILLLILKIIFAAQPCKTVLPFCQLQSSLISEPLTRLSKLRKLFVDLAWVLYASQVFQPVSKGISIPIIPRQTPEYSDTWLHIGH